MAENLSIQKSPVDSVLECPLCLHQLKLPQTLQQCLHSYCKSCLDKVPQKTQDGRQGWLCAMCENFTKCDQVQENTFIEELHKIHTDSYVCQKVKCEQCFDECGEATWKCAECKIGLCEIGKAVHLKIPMLKGHKMLPLDREEEKVIDNVIICSAHEGIPAQLNCRDCAQLICYKCNATDHQGHIAETVEQALERIVAVTESSVRKVDENIGIIEAQIEGVNKEIEQTKESYASCRMQMDDHLERVICRMRAKKAQMEEDVNEQESIALNTLQELKQQLERQLSQARILSNLTAVVSTKTRHTSQLQQLQNGLFKKVKSAGEIKKQGICFNLPTTDFVEGESFQEEIDKVFGKLVFDINEQIINIAGDSFTKSNQFLCNDLNELDKTKYKKDKETVVDAHWCNRLSYIDNQIWLPLDENNEINIYDEDGKLINVIDTGDKSITVVKVAHNGDVICAGSSGLFVTDKQFSKWTKLSEGEISDVIVHKDQLIALQYDQPSVHTYSLKDVNNQQESPWHECHSFVLDENLKVDHNSSICIFNTDHLLISSMDQNLYKYTCCGKYLDGCNVFPIDPIICGTDRNDDILLADFINGMMYLLKPFSDKRIPILSNAMLSSVQTPLTRSVVIDRNKRLWVLSGNDDFKLTRFVCEQ